MGQVVRKLSSQRKEHDFFEKAGGFLKKGKSPAFRVASGIRTDCSIFVEFKSKKF